MSDERSRISIGCRVDGNRVVVLLGGVVDAHAGRPLVEALPVVRRAGPRCAVDVDLSGVDHIDGAGADLLCRWCARVTTGSAATTLVSPSPAVRSYAGRARVALSGPWPAAAAGPGPGTGKGDPAGRDPLVEELTPAETLRLASRALVGAGADSATSHLHTSGSHTHLTLVGSDGLPDELVGRFGVVTGWGTPFGLAAATRRVVEVPNVASDLLLAGSEQGEAMLAAGIRSCASLPLVSDGGTTVGVISTYWDRPGRRIPPTITAVAAQAGRHLHAGRHKSGRSVGDPTREIADLKRALETRGVIGTAIGIVMTSFGLSEREAFARLVSTSQQSQVRLFEVARELVRHRDDLAGGRSSRRRHGAAVGADGHRPERRRLAAPPAVSSEPVGNGLP
jgi:anti-anti-sigma regulatory factor